MNTAIQSFNWNEKEIEKSKNCMKSSCVWLTSLPYSVIIMENKKWENGFTLWEDYLL